MSHEAHSMIELSDKPAVLVFGDGEAASGARRSAELAGCRVIDTVPIEDALARLERQAGMDAIFLELEEDREEVSEQLLDRLQELAEQNGGRAVISMPPKLIDLVAARTPSPLIQYLCEADELQRVAVIASACIRLRQRLHDAGKDRALPRLEQVSQEVARIAATLASLVESEARAGRSPPLPDAGGAPQKIDSGLVRAMIRARRLRDHYFRSDLFADPAWDILLDLFAARLEGQRVAVSSLCIAAAVPATTALRWIKTLTDMGLLVRSADPQDGRRVYIELSTEAAEGLQAFLVAAQRISPLIL